MGKKYKPKFKRADDFSQEAVPRLIEPHTTILFFLFFLVVVTAICFFPIFKNKLINWDDDFYVINNTLLHGPDWTGIFKKEVAANYHPLTILTLAINYAMSGTEAWSYLLFNLILHTINVILVFKFIYAISNKKEWVAFFTALVFAIHPMHVESVAWVSERKDVLYTFFFLLSLIQYWKFLQSGKRKQLWICLLFFVLSLLSKPAAIVLPLVLFLLDYWKGRPFQRKLMLEKIPFFLFAALFAIITLKIQSETAIINLETQPLWIRLFFACYGLMIYFFRFFIPYPLSAYHPYPPNSNLGFDIYVSPLFVVALLTFIWYLRKNRVFIFGILFFIINLLLVLQIVTIGSTVIAERYTYVPYIGLAFIIGMWLYGFLKKNILKWSIPAGIILVFGFITNQRTKIWRDSATFWTDIIDRFPDAAIPRNQRAIFYAQIGETIPDKTIGKQFLEKALEDCNVELKVKPGYTTALQNRQKINLDLGKNEDALADAEELIKLEPTNNMAYYTKGVVHVRKNEIDSAVPAFRKCLSLNPRNDEAWDMLGNVLMRKYHQFEEALGDFNNAISINPKGVYFGNRSLCYYNLGEFEKARNDALIALQKNIVVPDDYLKALKIK